MDVFDKWWATTIYARHVVDDMPMHRTIARAGFEARDATITKGALARQILLNTTHI